MVTKYRSKGSVSGYSVGVYGTWYANAQDQTGAYVDTWAQYNWFNNRVTGDHIQQERYRSQGLSASLEAGYRFKVGSGDTLDYFIQPQAQAIWMGVNAGDHRESNGTHISNQKGNQLETRVGLKMSAHTQKDLAARTDTSLNMFVEANWIHHAKDFDIRMDDVSVKQGGARNVGEIKVGIESKLNKQLSLWGNVSHQRGSQGFKDTSLNVGLKYQF
jgi:autotransporter family porin